MRDIIGFVIVVCALTAAMAIAMFSTPPAHAFFDQIRRPEPVSVSIGTFPFPTLSEWDSEADYEIGDRFLYDERLWEVRGDGDYSLPPEGDKLRPFGPYQEITEEYRPYNTYFEDDIVIYEGLEYQALHGGMSGIEPGTAPGWQALIDEWQFYNIYEEDDTVIYEGNTYEAQWWTQGDVPSENLGEDEPWRLVEFVLEPGVTTHFFDERVLEANILVDGVMVVEAGEILPENELGLEITKQQGQRYWDIAFPTGGSIRVRANDDTIQYQQNPDFDSIIFELD